MVPMQEDFHVYLFSSLNKTEFTRNCPSSFTNLISPNLNLDDGWEVGVKNIMFGGDLAAVKKGDCNYHFTVSIRDNKKKKTLREYVYRAPKIDIKGSTLTEIICNLDRDVVNFLVNHKVIEISHLKEIPSIFSYKNGENFVKYTPISLASKFFNTLSVVHYSVTWSVSPSIQKLLGLKDPSFVNIPTFTDNPVYPQTPNLLLLHSDIVVPSFFAGQLVHFLDVTPLGNAFYKSRENMIYKQVSNTSIQDISIKLTDENGELIPFLEGDQVFIILHFKKS